MEKGAKDIPRRVHTQTLTHLLDPTGDQGIASQVHSEKSLHPFGRES